MAPGDEPGWRSVLVQPEQEQGGQHRLWLELCRRLLLLLDLLRRLSLFSSSSSSSQFSSSPAADPIDADISMESLSPLSSEPPPSVRTLLPRKLGQSAKSGRFMGAKRVKAEQVAAYDMFITVSAWRWPIQQARRRRWYCHVIDYHTMMQSIRPETTSASRLSFFVRAP